ncbi:hypothetical protein PN441_18065 [Spirulina major CS-329]|uniref:hypothetical protein n=1 Tax=Spirulina TaxID=1154 RepID=UPI00232AC7EC|nr:MULTISPECIES: hypothetical protein [Spirulina]MDB9496824.1 hypothetical protein [Spirulina subsalsa CS-330]MDB9504987.1 hypothetical protein [Spirulina major CS-329]
MLAVNLDDEAEQYLIEILAQERVPSQELVKKLLRDYLATIRPSQTVLDRMENYNAALFDGEVDLSARSVRKGKIAEHLQARQSAQHEP